MKIGLPVLEKKIFEWFLPYMGVGPSWSCDLDFAIKLSSPLPMDVPQNFTLIGQAVSEEKIFEKCVWTTDWPRSRDDLDLN